MRFGSARTFIVSARSNPIGRSFAMRRVHLLPGVCFCVLCAATAASAATSSPPGPDMTSQYQTIADRQMEVAVNDTHLRSKPTTQSTKLATLKIGTKVDVIELVDNGQWAHVKVGSKTGYIRIDLLK
jgi:uncharacterized protein YgiM (DUF1202 family)